MSNDAPMEVADAIHGFLSRAVPALKAAESRIETLRRVELFKLEENFRRSMMRLSRIDSIHSQLFDIDKYLVALRRMLDARDEFMELQHKVNWALQSKRQLAASTEDNLECAEREKDASNS